MGSQNTHTAFGWIHAYDDYLNMFKLSSNDLNKSILVTPSDISNFNLIQHQQDRPTISSDPRYMNGIQDLTNYVQARLKNLENRLAKLEGVSHQEQIIQKWREIAHSFLRDFPAGLNSGRYSHLNEAGFLRQNRQFDLALCPRCSLEAEHKGYHEALAQITALCTIAKTTRVFVNLHSKSSIETIVGPLMVTLQQNNYGLSLHEIDVDSPNQTSAMLEVWATECRI